MPKWSTKKVQTLQSKGLCLKVALLTYTHGNNVGNFHFVWRVNDDSSYCSVLTHSQPTTEAIKSDIPSYHTKAMDCELVLKYGKVTPKVKPAILCSLYKELTGDHSASTNEHESEIAPSDWNGGSRHCNGSTCTQRRKTYVVSMIFSGVNVRNFCKRALIQQLMTADTA